MSLQSPIQAMAMIFKGNKDAKWKPKGQRAKCITKGSRASSKKRASSSVVKFMDEDDEDEMSPVNNSSIAMLNVSTLLLLSNNNDRYLYRPGTPLKGSKASRKKKAVSPLEMLVNDEDNEDGLSEVDESFLPTYDVSSCHVHIDLSDKYSV